MNILLIGSGGREHALAWKIKQSPLCSSLFVAPGNAGTAKIATNIDLDWSNHLAVIAFCDKAEITMVVVGPETPLVAGLVDALDQAGIMAFGPSRAAAQVEGSKAFTKELCDQAGIPTAAYRKFQDVDGAKAYARSLGKCVVKADGLMAGKGVFVVQTPEAAEAAIDGLVPFDCIIIEELLEGPEVSFFALADGTTVIPFGTACDYKRAYDGNLGPNTGGMGAFSPSGITPDLSVRILLEIIYPTISALRSRGITYKGILYAGIMLTNRGPKLIEYNCRFGDPECQVLMPRLESDLLETMVLTVNGLLEDATVVWGDQHAVTIVMASQGYPGAPQTGSILPETDQADLVFHAGTKLDGHRVRAIGGRVLCPTAKGADLEEARQNAYIVASKINWPEGFYRKDIAQESR
jgi:phosphoribosylamine--glycine ligase